MRFNGREIIVLLVIGVATPLLDHRLETAMFQFLFGVPSIVAFSNAVFSLTGGPLFGDLLQVWEQFGAVLAAFLVRKPGAGTIAMTINCFGQVFLNGTHAPHLLYGVAGLGADLVFAAFRYKRYDVLVAALAGMAASMFWYPIVYVTHAVYLYPPSFIVVDLIARALGSTVGDGLLGAALGIAVLSAVRTQNLVRRPVVHSVTNQNVSKMDPDAAFAD